MKALSKGIRPIWPDDVNPKLKELISKCWDSTDTARPNFGEIFNLLSNKNDQRDEEEDFMLDDVDVDEFNFYVEDITEVTDSTEKLLSKITKKDAEIKKLKEEIIPKLEFK